MEEKQTQNRPIDDLAKQSFDFWTDSFVFIKKAKIKTWQAIFAIAFISGVASSMVLTFSFDWSSSTSAATQIRKGPDLTVQSIIISTTTVGSVPAYKYEVKVKNSGTVASGQFQVNVSLTPAQPQSFTENGINKMMCFGATNHAVGALNPGQTTRVEGYFNPVASGTLTINANADFAKVILETNEFNNILKKSFNIRSVISKEFCPNNCFNNQCTLKTFCSDYILEGDIGTQIKYVITQEYKYPNSTRWPGFENIQSLYTTTCNGYYANYPISANVTSEINIYSSNTPQIAQDIEAWRRYYESKGLEVKKSLVKNNYVIDVIDDNNIWVGWASGNKAVFVISNSGMIYPNTAIEAYLAKYPSDLKADILTCTETDAVMDYRTKGLLTTNYPGWDPNKSYSDTCAIEQNPGNYVDTTSCSATDSKCFLNELYCNGDTPNHEFYKRPLGCVNGECKRADISVWWASNSPEMVNNIAGILAIKNNFISQEYSEDILVKKIIIKASTSILSSGGDAIVSIHDPVTYNIIGSYTVHSQEEWQNMEINVNNSNYWISPGETRMYYIMIRNISPKTGDFLSIYIDKDAIWWGDYYGREYIGDDTLPLSARTFNF